MEKAVTLRERIEELAFEYDGLRAAGRAVGLTAAYLLRLRDGENENPSERTMRKLGIRRVVTYYKRNG